MPYKNEYSQLVRDVLAFIGPKRVAPPVAPLPRIKKKIVLPKQEPLVVTAPLKPKQTFELKSIKAPEESSANFSRFAKMFPTARILADVPSDLKARRVKEAWKERKEIPDIPILCASPTFKPFLENIAKAIDLTFGSCRIIDAMHFEKNQSWDLFLEAKNIKLVIAQDSLIWNSKSLMSHYGQDESRFLLLPDLNLYLKDPYLKRSLWSVICKSLQSS